MMHFDQKETVLSSTFKGKSQYSFRKGGFAMRRSSIIASLTVLAVTVILFSAMPNWLTLGATDIGDKGKGFVGTW